MSSLHAVFLLRVVHVSLGDTCRERSVKQKEGLTYMIDLGQGTITKIRNTLAPTRAMDK